MLRARPRVVIDTNLWISFLIGKRLASLGRCLVDATIQVILCDQLLDEIREVTSRPKLRRYFAAEKIEAFLVLLLHCGVNVQITTRLDLCHDRKDNFLLALCVDSGADLLVTGDRDLLEIGVLGRTKIVTHKEFEELMTQ